MGVGIADGTRALTVAGRWSEALRHIEEHRGIGLRILDGRQVAVLAVTFTGDLPAAFALLEETEPGDPWEDAVTTALCRSDDQCAAGRAIDHCLAFEPEGDGRVHHPPRPHRRRRGRPRHGRSPKPPRTADQPNG
ncbi:hypothetical protein [Kitasatospora sp. CB01950]|uniref:hypothetical protein n=1 Tax=Kitasatospora sp. CB01950 TaxID=1703930 RepID=UPI00093E31AF|nr:hypothetical protein [Kitasatospora sp. CB01950]